MPDTTQEYVFHPYAKSSAQVEVTISGPQGSGKSLLAKAIYEMLWDEANSAAAAFVSVNGDRPVPITTRLTDA